MELVPIKVKIGLKNEGGAKYPDFNRLECVSGIDWSKYVDNYGLGWMYDKTSGHKDHTDDSPFGSQNGVLVVPEEFAEQALEEFPDVVSELSEAELEDFYDNKVTVKEPDEIINNDILAGIKAKQDLGLSLTAEQAKALDSEDDTIGINKNKKKKWADRKILQGVKIKNTKKFKG